MSRRAGLARVFSLFFATASACNGQFDFDTTPLDGGEPPIVVRDGAADDVTSRSEPATDIPGTGVRIGCGATACTSGACCSGTSGASCVQVEGGTCSGVLIQCDDTDDCSAGQVCCAEGDVGPRPQRVHCEPESHCRAMNFVILCNPDRPSPCTQCIATTLTGLPPGYHQCAAAP